MVILRNKKFCAYDTLRDMNTMIDLSAIRWRRDRRIKSPEVYVVPLDDPKNRINTFLSGWQAYLDDSANIAKDITWKNLGRLYASALGNIPTKQRLAIYAILLHQYVHSPRTQAWAAEDRTTALDHFANLIETISHDELVLQNLPSDSAPWSEIEQFALSFNGYEYHGSFDKCAEIANNHVHNTLTDLRTCLFFEQRRWRHFGDEPDDESMQYIRGILRNIREKVAKGDLI